MAVWSDKLEKEESMGRLKYEPVGMVYLTPGQRQARYIRKLERWVWVLGTACVLLAVVVCLLLLSLRG